jgi:hypothetical protein
MYKATRSKPTTAQAQAQFPQPQTQTIIEKEEMDVENGPPSIPSRPPRKDEMESLVKQCTSMVRASRGIERKMIELSKQVKDEKIALASLLKSCNAMTIDNNQ